jgi:hypothetical protein
MKPRARRVTIATAALGAGVIAVLVVLNWGAVRDHVKGWWLQLTRETETIEHSLVGEWETEPTLSQLGRIVTYYQFGDDGVFTCKMTFVDAKLPPMSRSGSYLVRGKTIDFTTEAKEATATLAFEDDMLVLSEGRDVFRLKRK